MSDKLSKCLYIHSTHLITSSARSECLLVHNFQNNCSTVPVNSKTAHPPRAIPGHLTRVKLRTVGNLTQNEARPVGHLTFVSKRLSAVGNKRISQFFDSAGAPRSRVIALVDSTWVFLLLSFLYRGICHCLKCGAKTS